MMINENTGNGKNSSDDLSWCRDMLSTEVSPHDILQFPYCILEVKLNCETPPVSQFTTFVHRLTIAYQTWINDLLARTDVIRECHKFSKFLTGVAYHQYDGVQELPYWFKDQAAIDPRNRFLPVEEKEKLLFRDEFAFIAQESKDVCKL